MLTEEMLKPILELNLNTGSVSVAIDVVIKRDGVVISSSRDRRAFNIGELENYKAYVGYQEGLDVTFLSDLWTSLTV